MSKNNISSARTPDGPRGNGSSWTERDEDALQQRLRGGNKSCRRLLILWVAFLVAAIVLALVLIRPAPPGEITIATGGEKGSVHKLGVEYAKIFGENGVKLDVPPTKGTMDNYRLLEQGPGVNGGPGATVAIVAGGQAPRNLMVPLRSIASLYLDPIWVFYRGDQAVDRLNVLDGKNLWVGPEDGSTRQLAIQLLDACGVKAKLSDPKTTLTGVQIVDQLMGGQFDAAFFVAPATSPFIAKLLAAESKGQIHLLSFERHEAFAKRFSFLKDVKLPRGVVDLQHDLPNHDVYLLAPAANLVARQDLNPSLIPLLLSAVSAVKPPRTPIEAQVTDLASSSASLNVAVGDTVVWINNSKVPHAIEADDGSFKSGSLAAGQTFEHTFDHAGNFTYRDTDDAQVHASVVATPMTGDLMVTDVHFPNNDFGEFPPDRAAQEYFKNGPPLLQRFLPFWVAAWVDRTKILLLPLITLLLPLIRLAPPLYVWTVRTRIYRWYRVLRHIDARLLEEYEAKRTPSFEPEIRLLDQMDHEVTAIQVPLSYMAEFYTLRQHADFLRQEIARRTRQAAPTTDAPT